LKDVGWGWGWGLVSFGVGCGLLTYGIIDCCWVLRVRACDGCEQLWVCCPTTCQSCWLHAHCTPSPSPPPTPFPTHPLPHPDPPNNKQHHSLLLTPNDRRHAALAEVLLPPQAEVALPAGPPEPSIANAIPHLQGKVCV